MCLFAAVDAMQPVPIVFKCTFLCLCNETKNKNHADHSCGVALDANDSNCYFCTSGFSSASSSSSTCFSVESQRKFFSRLFGQFHSSFLIPSL